MECAFAFVGAIDPSDPAEGGLFLPAELAVVTGSRKVGDDALRNCSLSFAEAVPSSGSWIGSSMLLSTRRAHSATLAEAA